MSAPFDHEAVARREIEDWRSSLRFFEAAAQHLATRQEELARDRGNWTEEFFRANAGLVASALHGAEIARRNLARLERRDAPPTQPGDYSDPADDRS